MKNIQQLNEPSQDRQTVERINHLTKTFSAANPNSTSKMLKTLAVEINQTEDFAVKNWLIKFDHILRRIN